MAIHPASIQNSFGRHLILWSLFLPLLAILIIPIFLPHQTLTQPEVDMVASLGVDIDTLNAHVDAKFTAMFVDTGMMKYTQDFFSSNKRGVFSFAGDWISGVWLMLYKATWRFFALKMVFLFPLIILVIPAAVDGFTVRAMKKYRFENSNPVFFYSSMHSLVFIVGALSFLPLAPFSLSAITLTSIIVAMVAGIWLTTSNFQTGS